MNLNDDEKGILDGGQGEIAQRCMEFLVDYGEAAGAERLVDLDGTVDLHPGTFWVTDLQSSPRRDRGAREQRERNSRCRPLRTRRPPRASSTTDGRTAAPCRTAIPAYHEKCLEPFKPWIKMGMIPTFACNSYLVASYLPQLGQHCAWVESSAIP